LNTNDVNNDFQEAPEIHEIDSDEIENTEISPELRIPITTGTMPKNVDETDI